jgi:hypothetical protein
MLKSVVQDAVKDSLRQLIAQFPTGFLLLNDETGEMFAASDRAMLALKLDALPADWQHWPVALNEFRLSLEGPDVQRAEVTIPWPENPRTFGFNLSTVVLNNMGKVRVCLFTDITQVIQDRVALDQFKAAFIEVGSAESQLTQAMLQLPAITHTLSHLTVLVQNCQHQVETATGLQPLQTDLQQQLPRLVQQLATLSGQLTRLQGEAHPLNIRPVSLGAAYRSALQQVVASDVTLHKLGTGTFTLKTLPVLPQNSGFDATMILADSIRLEQALALILQGLLKALLKTHLPPHNALPLHNPQATAPTEPDDDHLLPTLLSPQLSETPMAYQFTWALRGVEGACADLPEFVMAQKVLMAMGLTLAVTAEALTLTMGRWCDASTV